MLRRNKVRISTMKGLAAGGVLGMTIGASLLMMPQGRRMKKVLTKGGSQLARQIMDCWVQ